MKAKPILFTAKMVERMLAGKKWQTRRTSDEYRHLAAGDWLWVREPLIRKGTWEPSSAYYETRNSYGAHVTPVKLASGETLKWRWQRKRLPSIHMPREACRLHLQVVSVRQEPVTSISVEDAIAEGIVATDALNRRRVDWEILAKFRELWCSLHGLDAWRDDASVWVIEFRPWTVVSRW